MEKLKPLIARQQKTRINPIFLTITALSMICITISLLAQFKAHYKPCSLCLAQRYIYLGLAVLAVIGHFSKFGWLIRRVLFCVIFLGLVVALYQSLAHFGFITIKCSIDPANLSNLVNSQDFQASPNCMSQPFTIFGVPAALFNIGIFIFNGWLLSKDGYAIDRVI